MKQVVSVIAPSGRVNHDSWLLSKKELDPVFDLELFFDPQQNHFRFSASDEVRVENYHRANQSYAEIIWCARGGYGLSRIIEQLAPPHKIIAGFSDISILHAYNWSNTDKASYHCLMPVSFHKYDDTSKELTLDLFFTGKNAWAINVKSQQNCHLKGRLIGGNLSVLYGLIGTPYFQINEGDILFLEDLGEHYYHVDRMLWALKQAGVFNKIGGLLIGQFSDMLDKNDIGLPFRDLFLEKLPTKTPCIFGLPCGHEFTNYPLVFNRNIELTLENNTLEIAQKL